MVGLCDLCVCLCTWQFTMFDCVSVSDVPVCVISGVVILVVALVLVDVSPCSHPWAVCGDERPAATNVLFECEDTCLRSDTG